MAPSRYSPAEVVDVEVVPQIGMPDYKRHLHFAHRKTKPHDEDAGSQTDSAHKWLLEKMGGSENRCCIALRLLQFLAHPSDIACHACDGSGIDRPRSDNFRTPLLISV